MQSMLNNGGQFFPFSSVLSYQLWSVFINLSIQKTVLMELFD
jgi:hypothetical protein